MPCMRNSIESSLKSTLKSKKTSPPKNGNSTNALWRRSPPISARIPSSWRTSNYGNGREKGPQAEQPRPSSSLSVCERVLARHDFDLDLCFDRIRLRSLGRFLHAISD